MLGPGNETRRLRRLPAAEERLRLEDDRLLPRTMAIAFEPLREMLQQ